MAAGDAVYVGTTDWTVVVEYKHSYAKGEGWRHVYTYEGPESGRVAKEIALQAAGAITVDGQTGTPARIVATFPDEYSEINIPSPIDTESEWTLDPYDLSKELGTHGKFQESASEPAVLAKIEDALRKGVADQDWDTAYSYPGNMLNTYRNLRGQGVKEWETQGFILRRSVVVTEKGSAEGILRAQLRTKTGASQIGKIITWNSINVPQDAGVEMPFVHLYIGTAMTLPTGASGTIPAWLDIDINEWKVQAPRLGYSRVGKIRKRRIDFEWKGAVQWSSALYDGGTGTP